MSNKIQRVTVWYHAKKASSFLTAEVTFYFKPLGDGTDIDYSKTKIRILNVNKKGADRVLFTALPEREIKKFLSYVQDHETDSPIPSVSDQAAVDEMLFALHDLHHFRHKASL